MEVMEDGNLMDKVHILIQRDMEYYKSKQAILQETICKGVIGGKLDFPRSASFASVKLVLWWEEEYLAAFKKYSGFVTIVKPRSSDASDDGSHTSEGIVKDSDSSKFSVLVTKSAEELLGHLHKLTQEALDHADLTVLTGTIGAAALLKNCLWFFVQSMEDKRTKQVQDLQSSYKKYNEMVEALAERLLDLHCRLLSLYILQDAECLDWENSKPFFESERGSYIIQMWWLYMQGTKEDLWNTVPPKMAQRVFAGMLNESLTILTVRYTQSIPSPARSQLLVVDISNLLLCVAQLLPAICDSAKDFIGFSYTTSKSKMLRDIHCKCQELLNCFLLRGAPLDDLYKIFKNGLDNAEILKPKTAGPAPWVMFALPYIFKGHLKRITKMNELGPEVAIALELMVLLAQPQPNWALLLKVLCMKKFRILEMILHFCTNKFSEEIQRISAEETDCGSFLCNGDGTCKASTSSISLTAANYYDLILSATQVLLYIGNDEEFSDILMTVITKHPNWAKCFERRNVWNQIRPPWYEAMTLLVTPLLSITSETVINALQTDASMYQAMAIVLACFSQFWDSIHSSLPRVSNLLQEYVPSDIIPLNHSCLLQTLISALYTDLLKHSQKIKKEVKFTDVVNDPRGTVDGIDATPESIALAAAEALCSIDEDNKHTDQIEELLEQVKDSKKFLEFIADGSGRVESNQQMAEILVSDILIAHGGKTSLKTLYHFIKCNSEWLYQQLGVSEDPDPVDANRSIPMTSKLLHTMFHIGYRPFDQLLTGTWQPKWLTLLQTPMGLSPERIWMQLSLRWEFRNIVSTDLCAHDVHIINSVGSLLKP